VHIEKMQKKSRAVLRTWYMVQNRDAAVSTDSLVPDSKALKMFKRFKMSMGYSQFNAKFPSFVI